MGRLGILGTLVWDTIHGPEGGDPVRDWGGIAYSLAAFEAVAPAGWEAVPIIKVGSDMRAEADRFLASLTRIGTLEHVVSVPEANNRVELFYRDQSRRCERLTGGVPGWSWPDLGAAVRTCDALYVNFIAGWEMDLDAARALARRTELPGYCDVHSLLLEVTADGVREPRPLSRRSEWIGAFDLVQVNETELGILSTAGPDRAAMAEDLLADGPEAVFVTLGRSGAEWRARPDSRYVASEATDRQGSASVEIAFESDPTGCGDVWGVACFASLLSGATLGAAVVDANRAASACARSRGTSGLTGELAHPAGTDVERGAGR